MDHRQSFQTSNFLNPSFASSEFCQFPDIPMIASCVVPSVRRLISKTLDSRKIVWISADLDIGIDFSGVDRTTLGADRVANAAAAAHTLQLPAIVIDCGTAITTEIIDGNKRFLGGVIMPGRTASRKALASLTAQLPIAKLSPDTPPPLGTNTDGAIRAGVDLGLLGAVRYILDQTIAVSDLDDATTIAVGGDREYFSRNLSGVLLGPPDFTLIGLSEIAIRLK